MSEINFRKSEVWSRIKEAYKASWKDVVFIILCVLFTLFMPLHVVVLVWAMTLGFVVISRW